MDEHAAPNPDEYISLPRAAWETGISPHTLHLAAATGRLAVRKVEERGRNLPSRHRLSGGGKITLVRRADLHAFLLGRDPRRAKPLLERYRAPAGQPDGMARVEDGRQPPPAPATRTELVLPYFLEALDRLTRAAGGRPPSQVEIGKAMDLGGARRLYFNNAEGYVFGPQHMQRVAAVAQAKGLIARLGGPRDIRLSQAGKTFLRAHPPEVAP